jgi:DNA-binding GntR family transcriptional regulator
MTRAAALKRGARKTALRDAAEPLYRQVLAALRDDIRRGRVRSGDALQSESQLCERFQVSRVTVRQALHKLQIEGLALSKQGKGTFVRSGPIEHELGEFHTLTEVLARHGYPREVKLLTFVEIRPPRAVAEDLELRASERCVLVKRRHLMGRQPVALTVMYFPLSIVREWRAAEFEAKTIYELAAEHDLGPVEGRRVITTTRALTDVANALDLDVGDPVLLMRSRSKLVSGAPLESSAFYFHPTRYSFLFSFTRGDGAARPADSGGHDF